MSKPKARRNALWLIPCAPLFAACSPTPEPKVLVQIERVVVTPPPALLRCEAEPRRPAGADADQDVLAGWIVDVTIAGRSCRDRLDAIRKFVDDTR
ncbi:MAG: hypothetical protein NBV67_00460 [Tagaea sp.]|nr:hypothetical protein [Tagaea sp.]